MWRICWSPLLVAFAILSFHLQGGLERITKYMMLGPVGADAGAGGAQLCSCRAQAEGLKFYLVPDFAKDRLAAVVVGAMNQAFFTLSVGMGGMAIFGSYIEKEHSLMGESVHIIVLDTLVAVLAGIIMFPACFTYGLEVSAGSQPAVRYHGYRVQQHDRGPLVGHAILFVHGVCRTFHRVGRVRKHPCHGAGADRMVKTAPRALCCVAWASFCWR